MSTSCNSQCTSKCEFDLDMDGQVTCVMCGSRESSTPKSWGDLPPASFEE
jgi:hypothetical protein